MEIFVEKLFKFMEFVGEIKDVELLWWGELIGKCFFFGIYFWSFGLDDIFFLNKMRLSIILFVL